MNRVLYYKSTHNIAEGAGGAALAVAMQEKNQLIDKKVGVILSGSNIDMELFSQIINY